MFNIKVDYPSAEEEERILASTTRGETVEVRKVLSGKAILNLQSVGGQGGRQRVHRAVRFAAGPRDAAEGRVRAEVRAGVGRLGRGPRAGQFLIQGGKALAAMDGRFSVAIEDVQKIAIPVLRHRISTNFQAQAEGMTTEDIIAPADPRDAAAGDSEI